MRLLGVLIIALTCSSYANGSIIDDFFQRAFNEIRPKLKDYYQEKLVISNITLINLFVDGLDKFYPAALNIGLLPMKIKNVTLVIDDIKAKSRYQMKDMTVPGPITLFGAGDLSLNVTGLSIFLQATLSVLSKVVTIKDIEDMKVHADKIQIEMTGLVGGGPVGELISSIMNAVATPAFNILISPTLLENKATLIQYINSILSQIKM